MSVLPASARPQEVQISEPPPVLDSSASAAELENQGDQLRAQKRYLDSIDFYKVALNKQPSALLWNKEGMSYLLLQRPEQAARCFDHAIKSDRHAPEGYNNRGYIEQMKRKYDKAIHYYRKAIQLRPDDAVFHYNMASSYFGKHEYAQAAQEYKAAFALDPDIFIRVSRTGIMAQATSPEDRAAFSFMVAKMYAEAGDVDHSLEYLRKAMENGYKHINEVYTDREFATLRTNKRFEALMAQRPQPIP
ncbi:MAG TPA: tetratricopeptide repeat protein [Candidatus Binatia bacterium]|nr:tetratricopeptide repeat protein [Candidatus Binatia bacterium]